jgi:hypothetical protein
MNDKISNIEKLLEEAKKYGIADIDIHGTNEYGVSLDTLKWVTAYMKEHGEEIYKDLDELRKQSRKKL